CHPHGLYFYNQDQSAIANFVAAAEKFRNVACTISRHKETDYVYTGRRNRREPNGIFEWARGLGLLGKNARNKEIPGDAFALANPQLGLLLARMWEGDGHVNLNGRSAFYATASKRLAHQVSHVLLRLGIVPRLREVDFPYKVGRVGYQVFVTGNENLRAFADKVAVHMLPGSKRDRANAVVLAHTATTSSKDTVPSSVYGSIASARERACVTWPEVAAATSMAVGNLRPSAALAHNGGYTRATVAKLASYFDSEELYRVSESDVLWDPVVSIEPLGEMRTYDLEVEGTHNFVANDIIVHNSHAVAYSIISYQTAWLKTHFPAEFMAALLSSQIGDTDSVVKYINEAREIELEVLPPDVNESNYKFTVI